METRHIMIEKPSPSNNSQTTTPRQDLSAGISAHPTPPPQSTPTSRPPNNDAQITSADSGGQTIIGGCDRHGRQVGPRAPVNTLARLSTHTPDTHPELHKTPPYTPHNPLQPNQDQKTESTRARQRTAADRTCIVAHTGAHKPRPQSRRHPPPSPCPHPKNPRFTERELRTMVDEILKVVPQIFGSEVQHTPIARKMELWQTIVNRVNAEGHHPRTRDDIRKRWNDL
ncbi:hypothetical protein NDU88_006291 [Pleurodeles waltl]|uniref:Myb/SANT-like DNA-binding domain-containing protein n=1 Tax=Pleurodeles waltl TaxID=8319 RepID=A0AAV7ULP4_PLEWA|nr:hypothetical protein NDU88_006291 [Pleurodeles waltl]